jgi:hypothetical protein
LGEGGFQSWTQVWDPWASPQSSNAKSSQAQCQPRSCTTITTTTITRITQPPHSKLAKLQLIYLTWNVTLKGLWTEAAAWGISVQLSV